MWPDSRLCDLLAIDHPIIQAPMLGSCTPALASAVSNAGALGSYGCGLRPVADLEGPVGDLRQRTNRPANLNFFVGPAAETDATVLAAARERVRPWYRALGLGEPPTELPAIGRVSTTTTWPSSCGSGRRWSAFISACRNRPPSRR